MITERYADDGNLFVRYVVIPATRFMGNGDLFLEHEVPDVLDHRIPQPQGVSVQLLGAPDNLTVITHLNHDQSVLFNNLVPPGTSFAIHPEEYYDKYEVDTKKKQIRIPRNHRKQQFITNFALLHEGAHIWLDSDEEQFEKVKTAKALLSDQLFSRALDGYVWLPEEQEDREQHVAAWQVFGAYEQSVSRIALYTVGRLREVDIDLLPHLSTSQLTRQINVALKGHEVFGLNFQLKPEDVQ